MSHLYGGEFRSDGTLMVCGTNDSSVVVFDIKTGHKLRELTGHQKYYYYNNI